MTNIPVQVAQLVGLLIRMALAARLLLIGSTAVVTSVLAM